MDTHYIFLDAINVVLAWDLPDEFLAEAVMAQAGLMAGFWSE